MTLISHIYVLKNGVICLRLNGLLRSCKYTDVVLHPCDCNPDCYKAPAILMPTGGQYVFLITLHNFGFGNNAYPRLYN